jgi:UDP-glucose 4-epimerase
MSSQRILLTGATGFIGRHLLGRLAETEGELHVLTRRPLPSLPRGASAVYCDITDPFQVRQVREIEGPLVIHLAAGIPQTSIPSESLEHNVVSNVLPLMHLLPQLRGVRYFIYTSTLDVYGLPRYAPLDEKHPTEPATYYAAAKLGAEKLLQAYAQQTGTPLLILRLTQVYGPGEPVIKVIPQTIARVARGEPPVLHGDGSDSRDYIHVADVVEIIMRALRRQPTGTLNVATGASRSIADVVRTVIQASGRDLTPIFKPRQKPCCHFSFDISRLRAALGELDYRPFADGIREQYEHYLRS